MDQSTSQLERKEKKTKLTRQNVGDTPQSEKIILQESIMLDSTVMEQLDQIDERGILDQVEASQAGREVEIETDRTSESSSKGSSIPQPSSELGLPDSDDYPIDALTEQAEIYARAPQSRLPTLGSQSLIEIHSINIGTVCHANQLETIKSALQEYVVLMNKQYNITLPMPRIYGSIGECQRSENLVERYKRMDSESLQVQPSTSKQIIPMRKEANFIPKLSQPPEVEQVCEQRESMKDTSFENHPVIKQLVIGAKLKPLLGVGRDLIINSSTKGFSIDDIRAVYRTSQTLPEKLNVLIITLFKKQNKFNQMSKRYNLFEVDPVTIN